MKNVMNGGLAMLGLALCASAAGITAAGAQSYPSKPVRLVSTYAPGGTNDLLSRLVAQKLTERLGKPVIVENRTGANGILGTQTVAKSAPDGYTLMMGNSATHGINPSVYRKLPYDAIADFVHIMQERIRQLGGEPGGGTPEQFLAFVRAEIARYAHVVKASGFKVE